MAFDQIRHCSTTKPGRTRRERQRERLTHHMAASKGYVFGIGQANRACLQQKKREGTKKNSWIFIEQEEAPHSWSCPWPANQSALPGSGRRRLFALCSCCCFSAACRCVLAAYFSEARTTSAPAMEAAEARLSWPSLSLAFAGRRNTYYGRLLWLSNS